MRNGSATSGYNAYGTTINGVYFDHIRRGHYGMTSCNALQVGGITFGTHCGATATEGAICFDGTGDQATANQISDVVLEATGYVYPIHLTNASNNTFRGLQIWDQNSTMLAAIIESGTSNGNHFEGYIPVSPLRITPADHGSFRTGNSIAAMLGGAVTTIQPQVASASGDATVLLLVKRSLAESVSPNAMIAQLTQGGAFAVTAALPSVTLTHPTAGNLVMNWTSLVRSAGSIDLYAGAAAADLIRVRRGCLAISSYTTATRPTTSGLVGLHCFDTTLNKPIWSGNGGTWVDATGTAV